MAVAEPHSVRAQYARPIEISIDHTVLMQLLSSLESNRLQEKIATKREALYFVNPIAEEVIFQIKITSRCSVGNRLKDHQYFHLDNGDYLCMLSW